MVLHDVLLGDMGFDTLQQVTRPKVEGSIHLSNLFPHNTLEFLVFFSSIASVMGNYGQCSYSAANMFMQGLANQRKQRGLAASVIHIGPLKGVGYLTERGIDIPTLKIGSRCIAMSEQDFHQLFAEAIRAGHPQSRTSIEISSGLRQLQRGSVDLTRWDSNPVMSHYLLESKVRNNLSASGCIVPLRTRLTTANTYAEVYNHVRAAFVQKLGTLFQLDVATMDQPSLDATRLDEIGMDSLIAIEIRAWLMDNISVNFPVLKILAGMCVKELLMSAIDDMSPALIPNAQPTVTSPHTSVSQTSEGETTSVSNSLSISTAGDDSSESIDLSLALSASVSEEEDPESGNTQPIVLTTFDLSFAQEMFWIASSVFGGMKSQNITGWGKLTGPVRVDDLDISVRSLGQQHECFRTCFFISGGKLVQGVMEKSILHLEHKMISDVTGIKQTTQELQEYIYDIERGETVRLVLLSLSSHHHFLAIGATHLCMDGSSFQVLVRSLFRYYDHQPLTAAIFQYREYIDAQSTSISAGNMETAMGFWKTQFRDLPPVLPILRVSPVVNRPKLGVSDHLMVEIKINPTLKSQILMVCRKNRVTPFQYHLACFAALLSMYADVEDVAIGMIDGNRSEHKDSIGVFLNILPLRLHPKSSTKFEEVLREAKAVVHAALQHSQVPFQFLVKE